MKAFMPVQPAVLKGEIQKTVHGDVDSAGIQIPAEQGNSLCPSNDNEQVADHGRQKGIKEMRHFWCNVFCGTL